MLGGGYDLDRKYKVLFLMVSTELDVNFRRWDLY